MNESNFTSCVWWALIEKITPLAEEVAGEKEMACCVRGYHLYKGIWAATIPEVLVCSMEPTNIVKIFIVELYSRKIFSYVFCVRKYFYNENKANCGTVPSGAAPKASTDFRIHLKTNKCMSYMYILEPKS